MKERILSLLNLKASESRFVFDLLRIQFFIGIANAFINIVAFTLFIHSFSINGLTNAYLAIAGFLIVLNLGYERMENRLSPISLLKVIVVLASVITFLFWGNLTLWDQKSVIFLLLVWSVLIYMVTGYAYWGLVSLLFNIRESKRVFTIVGAGDIPAKLIGYLSAPLLVDIIGLNHLLLVALGSLGVTLIFISKLVGKKSLAALQLKHEKSHHSFTDSSGIWSLKNNFFLNNKLILAISLLAILSYNVFNFIDFTFISQVKVKFNDVARLAFFIAFFFGIGRIAALLLKLLFSSRVIERLGVITCLLITPAALFICSLALWSLNDKSHYSLYFFGIMALITEVLRSTIQEPAFFILFQPLNEHKRLKGHLIAKGYMLPPSLLIVGISLIAIRNLGIHLTILFTIKVVLINLVLWALIVYFIRNEYVKSLHKSLLKGVYTGEGFSLYDQKTVEILLDKTTSSSEPENIYALKLLENASYEGLDELLFNCLSSNKTEVKKYALHRLEQRHQLTVTRLTSCLMTEEDSRVKQMIISILIKMDPSFLQLQINGFESLDNNTKKSLVIFLLEQKEFHYLYEAGTILNHLLSSDSFSNKELALEIISELKYLKFTFAINALINDANISVKRSAITASCKMNIQSVLPLIFNLLNEPSNKYVALQGLFQYGDALFNDISFLEPEKVERHKAELVKIATKTKGNYSTNFLLANLHDKNLADKVIHGLWYKGYEAEAIETIHTFGNLLSYYLDNAIRKIQAYMEVPNSDSMEVIKSSILSDITIDTHTVLKLCSILYHKRDINRTLELLEKADKIKIFNAMEMLELVLPKKVSVRLTALLEFVIDPYAPKKKFLSSTSLNFYDFIFNSDKCTFNVWTKALCLYAPFKNGDRDVFQLVNLEPDKEDMPILREVKETVLNALQHHQYVNY